MASEPKLFLETFKFAAAARRAYRTTRSVLHRCDDQAAIDGFGGYPRDDVARMLERKTAGQQ